MKNKLHMYGYFYLCDMGMQINKQTEEDHFLK